MNELMKVKTNDGKEITVIDSREVAEMMGKEHKEILQYLEGLKTKEGKVKVVGIIPTLEQSGDVHVANYFIESTYNDRGRIKKCYLVTKMGCEMLGNKQKGEKGILFTAKYVERFNQYEEQLKELTQPKLPQTYKEALYALIEAEEEKERLMLENEQQKTTIKEITTHALTIEDSRKVINKLVRTMAMVNYHGNFKDCWSALYTKYNYLCGTNIRNRKRAKGESLLNVLSEDEIYKMEEIVKSWCTDNNIDIDKELKLI